MKIISSFFILMILSIGQAFAHYLWVETNPNGAVGKSQEVRVYFGEYTYGVVEKPAEGGFDSVKAFKVWVLAPNGEKQLLEFSAAEEFFVSSFTPATQGVYTVILNNDEIDVIDYTKYDFGIFKTHYHSVAKVTVGKSEGNTIAQNPTGITVEDITGKSLTKGATTKLRVLYKGEPLAGNEVKVFVADQWSKELETNEAGEISFDLPWDTKYILEITKKEETPGSYKGEDYEFVWHCVTYCITTKG